jgi:hypothetical protein
MELVTQYIEGLNAAIQAGSDLRTILGGVSVPVIRIEIDEEACDIVLTFLNKQSPFDKTSHVPLRTLFTVELNDYPNELRKAGWE